MDLGGPLISLGCGRPGMGEAGARLVWLKRGREPRPLEGQAQCAPDPPTPATPRPGSRRSSLASRAGIVLIPDLVSPDGRPPLLCVAVGCSSRTERVAASDAIELPMQTVVRVHTECSSCVPVYCSGLSLLPCILLGFPDLLLDRGMDQTQVSNSDPRGKLACGTYHVGRGGCEHWGTSTPN